MYLFFFRNAFSNLMDLIDKAARIVGAALDEPFESNFIRRNVIRYVELYSSQGKNENEAWGLAQFRIISCPPGTYGAGDISKVMDIIIGWDATAEVMEDWMYTRIAQKYALYKEMQKWFKEVNPYVLQNILDKFLEAVSRGMWNADSEMKSELRDAYRAITSK